MKKNQFCREVNSPWTRRLLHSVPIALSLFVAISSAAEAMALMLLKFLHLSKLQNLLVLLLM